ncbi:LTA synthase family protein [Azohydromonas lata]|uniref:LTA synthase family protein n=1 Tax=Azohydromonas lata TaxID=45677 RepID=A0ABU5IK00_9BURK|nr:LTA synthase family protein [Azohydromonas lata]MDZ5459225.1 LTA synthase family protein [Azohydromonas lata]
MSNAFAGAGLTRWFPQRLKPLVPLVLGFMLFNALVRLGLLAFNGQWSLVLPWRLLPILGIGALFDLGVATFFLPPLGWLLLAWPARRTRGLRWTLLALLLPLCVLAVFVAASEFTFWNEFASRFNFIAVDYLVYTNEVLGNIRESYNMPLLLSAVGAVALTLWVLLMRRLSRPQLWSDFALSWRRRAVAALALAAAPVLAYVSLDARYKEFSEDAQANELAGNGYFDFWHAFWHNEIDYERFYSTVPDAQAAATLSRTLGSPSAANPFDRDVEHQRPEKRLNVVLVSVESLSASFLGSFGNQEGLTPHLDRLAKDGLLFTRLYATGTRTVRGLEALSLSVPPTPGHSIVKRPDNGDLFTVGEVFKSKGYEPLYIYGGYGYFDNMNAFFGGNGYTVIDRTALKADEIHFENIWGVADEDLFSLTLRELDARAAAKKPFFAHVMTTSNHRPYTYPAGRIDIPSKTGREGGVKYTDWAIGDFIERARQKPWFDDTVFVIVADHTHNGRGRQELPPDNYHIPMVIYAPKHVAPGRVESIASQIDVAPTLLGLLNFSYHSRFFGQDILREGQTHQRALLANYQTVGLYEEGRVVELKPGARSRVVDAESGQEIAQDDALSRRLRDEAIAYYQVPAKAYRKGELRLSAMPLH